MAGKWLLTAVLVALALASVGCAPMMRETRTQDRPEYQRLDEATQSERALYMEGYMRALEEMRRKMNERDVPVNLLPSYREGVIKFYLNDSLSGGELYYVDRDSWDIYNEEGDKIEYGLAAPVERRLNLNGNRTQAEPAQGQEE